MSTIHLIDCGDVPAIPSSELRVGMRLTWNYGSQYEVVSIRDVSAQYIEIVERCVDSAVAATGKEYTRRLKKSRLVAAQWPQGSAPLDQSPASPEAVAAQLAGDLDFERRQR